MLKHSCQIYLTRRATSLHHIGDIRYSVSHGVLARMPSIPRIARVGRVVFILMLVKHLAIGAALLWGML